MKLRSVAAVMVVLIATTMWAQSTQPSTPAVSAPAPLRDPRLLSGRRGGSTLSLPGGTGAPATVSSRQHMQDMEGTLTGMHTLLKQMRAKAALTPKDPMIKANLEMWELLVAHLDKQLLELRTAVAARDDLEARRAALYKQADEKAAAAAQAARSASAAQAQAAAPASAPAPPAQSIQTQPASSTPSPN